MISLNRFSKLDKKCTKKLKKLSNEPKQNYYDYKMIGTKTKDLAKTRNFPVKISFAEEKILRKEADESGKSIAALIREGYLTQIDIDDLHCA